VQWLHLNGSSIRNDVDDSVFDVEGQGMMAAKISIKEQAITWTIRVRETDFDDWDALTAWLEADELHSKAFQHMTMLDDMLPDMIARRASDQWRQATARPQSRRAFVLRGSIAAAIVAVFGLSVLSVQYLPYSVETSAGERESITLADGSRIDLNGNTRIALSRNNPRRAELEQGEALFNVVHNERQPFIVKVGGAVVEDAGTVFNIIRDGATTEVGVSAGSVIYNPATDRVALKAGSAIRATDQNKEAEVFATSVAAVGSWQRNQLTYNNAPLGRVATDLSRSLGEPITVSTKVQRMRFTGTINLQKDAGRFFDEAAPVLDVRAKRAKAGWILVGSDEAIP
jgi:transmembrane sensor